MNGVDEVVLDPQVNARDMIVELPTWTGGSLRVSNTPVKLSRTPGGAERGAAKPGEHANEILGAVGYSEDEVARLIESGAVGQLREE